MLIASCRRYWEDPDEFRPARFLAQHPGKADHEDDGLENKEEEKSAAKSPTSTGAKAKKQHPYAFIAFNAGPRKCVGKVQSCVLLHRTRIFIRWRWRAQNFAMIEIKIIVALLVQRLRMRLVPGQRIHADPISRTPTHGMYMQVS